MTALLKFLPLSNAQLFWVGIVIVAVSSFLAGWEIHSWKTDAKELATLKSMNEAIQSGITKQRQIDRLTTQQSLIKEAEIRVVYREVLREVKGATTNIGCLNTTGGRVWNRALQGRSNRETDSGTPTESASGTSPSP